MVITPCIDPLRPVLVKTIPADARRVEFFGPMLLSVGHSSWFSLIDPATGTVLDEYGPWVMSGDDVAVEGSFVYLLEQTGNGRSTLTILEVTPAGFIPLAALPLPNETERITVAGGIGYVVNTTFGVGVTSGGYLTVDVRNPKEPRIISTADHKDRPRPGAALALNGSGLGLLVGTLPPGSGVATEQRWLVVHDVSDPNETDRVLTQYDLPAPPLSVTIASGVAFVADGKAGLQIVTYRPFDTAAIAPTIRLSTSFPLDSPTTGTVECGKLLRISADVKDDVQVRAVEFYLDGVLALADVTFPFEYRLIAPFGTVSRTNFTFRARAVDTGGNATWTDNFTITLIGDEIPPTVVGGFPAPEAVLRFNTRLVTIAFSEPMDPATLTAAIRLEYGGPDGLIGTADDVALSAMKIEYQDDLSTVFIRFERDLPVGWYVLRIGPPAADHKR